MDIPDDSYETDPGGGSLLRASLRIDYFNVENYPEKLAQVALLNQVQGRNKKKALNIGCKTGRTAFELGVEFESVTATDFSARMIRIGVDLKGKRVHPIRTSRGRRNCFLPSEEPAGARP